MNKLPDSWISTYSFVGYDKTKYMIKAFDGKWRLHKNPFMGNHFVLMRNGEWMHHLKAASTESDILTTFNTALDAYNALLNTGVEIP